MNYITCTNLSFAYDGNVVLDSVNFTVTKGDYLCILGENGSGKSTLVKGLLGLKRPHHGNMQFGKGITQKSIGYLPQHKNMLKDFPASVFEVALSGRMSTMGLRPYYTKLDKEIASSNLSKFDMLTYKDKAFSELSGGEQQRVLLARALCSTQELLVMDEPVSGLDPIVTAELYANIKDINRNEGLTIIMVSHDVQKAVESASHILHLGNKQLFFGTKEAFIQSQSSHQIIGGDYVV